MYRYYIYFLLIMLKGAENGHGCVGPLRLYSYFKLNQKFTSFMRQ